ncbi:transposase [Nocardia xishanensis]|uniref:Transposase n=1 Tax=Nocardia xishanensis TaxID=238964 RepID=A0ABW7XCW0_9NOCA
MLYITGLQINRASDGYRGSGKTDAKDAAVIADQARMRRDLAPLRVDHELVVELRMLVARRRDVAGDRVRLISRLHQQLLAISPALEHALDLTNRGPLVLLSDLARRPSFLKCPDHPNTRKALYRAVHASSGMIRALRGLLRAAPCTQYTPRHRVRNTPRGTVYAIHPRDSGRRPRTPRRRGRRRTSGAQQ